MKNFFLSLVMACFALVIFEISLGGPSTLAIYLYYDFDSKTKGVITWTKYRNGSTRSPSTFEVRYRYSVDGVIYVSKYVNFYGFAADSEINKSRFFLGKDVDVYFNSNFPNVAVLEKTSIGKVVLLQIFFVFCIGFYPLLGVIYRRFWS